MSSCGGDRPQQRCGKRNVTTGEVGRDRDANPPTLTAMAAESIPAIMYAVNATTTISRSEPTIGGRWLVHADGNSRTAAASARSSGSGSVYSSGLRCADSGVSVTHEQCTARLSSRALRRHGAAWSRLPQVDSASLPRRDRLHLQTRAGLASASDIRDRAGGAEVIAARRTLQARRHADQQRRRFHPPSRSPTRKRTSTW